MPAKQLVCWGEAVVVVVVVVVVVGCFSSIDHYSMGLSPDRLALSRYTFPSLPPLGGVTTQLLRRKTDKQRPVRTEGARWEVVGRGRARDLTAGSAALQLILSGHVDTTDYTNQWERERERDPVMSNSILIKQTDYVKMSPPGPVQKLLNRFPPRISA